MKARVAAADIGAIAAGEIGAIAAGEIRPVAAGDIRPVAAGEIATAGTCKVTAATAAKTAAATRRRRSLRRPGGCRTGRDRYVTIRSARCQTLLGLSEDDRAAASLFYIGYQASRFRARSINVNAIPDAENEALNYCQTFPNRTVAEAFAKAFLRVLR